MFQEINSNIKTILLKGGNLPNNVNSMLKPYEDNIICYLHCNLFNPNVLI